MHDEIQVPRLRELLHGRELTAGILRWRGPRGGAEDVYLVTGGTGGIGLLTAHSLLDWGAKRILLASRSGRIAGTNGPTEVDCFECRKEILAGSEATNEDVGFASVRPSAEALAW